MITHHIVAIAAAVGLVAPVAYVALDRDPCVTVRSAELLTPVLRPGEVMRGRIVVDRNASCEYHRTSILKDGAQSLLPYQAIDLSVNGEIASGDVIDFAETIPDKATPGPAEYWRWGTYKRSRLNDYWPLPPVLLAHFHLTILESEETQRVNEILRLLESAADQQDKQ